MSKLLRSLLALALLTAVVGPASASAPEEGGLMAVERPITGTVFVANESDGSVSVINAATNEVVTTLTGVPGPHNVQVSPDGATLWVTSLPLEQAIAIDTATWTLLAAVPVGRNPAHVIVTPDGTEAWVTNSGDNTLSVIDTSSYTVTATVGVGEMPHGMRASADGRMVAVANMMENTVSVLDARTLRRLALLEVGEKPVQVAFSPHGHGLFVSLNGTGEVAHIQTDTWEITHRGASAPGPVQVFASLDGIVLAVANQGTKDNPGQALSLLNQATLAEVATIETGNGPHGVVITPDSSTAYVTNLYDGTLAVVDLRAAKVVATIAVGDTPNGVSFSPLPPAPAVSVEIAFALTLAAPPDSIETEGAEAPSHEH